EGGQTPLARRLPKVGFNHETRFPMAIVNLDMIDKAFDAGADVTPETMAKAKLVDPKKGGVKVLGRGEVTKKLTVKANAISDSARAKIEAAGGAVEVMQFKTYGRPNKPVKRA
ncbi:MAG TPA: 50S ribosomal protein L15, partial [Candidatus Hydrogenedentes bacterium]|nr:50S ribosomal protein L15 [Candidatus Hydrogenedentota bacterium]